MKMEAEWMLFRGRDIAPNAPNVQQLEMRKAFYAGMASGIKLSIDTDHTVLLDEMKSYVAAENARRNA